MSQLDQGELNKIVDKWEEKKGSLIMVLHQVQDTYGYVPEDAAVYISKKLNISLSKIYGVLTFYNLFKLKAPGKHKISVCMGTACYLKGAPDILNEIKTNLKIEEGEISSDGLFQFETVRCLGCCGLAPVMTINGKVFGKIKKGETMGIISNYLKEVQQ